MNQLVYATDLTLTMACMEEKETGSNSLTGRAGGEEITHVSFLLFFFLSFLKASLAWVAACSPFFFIQGRTDTYLTKCRLVTINERRRFRSSSVQPHFSSICSNPKVTLILPNQRQEQAVHPRS
ncbi:hypothetical protein H113_01357 [Trichophyton rubrum MR1459]|uniref:Uncharacterized protein n=1 Tax=Trichophyton rubrum (strain ATCC MYA-4607 / CBS 118892) TaxID=559305 RepID=A0A080WWU7_TRIRC|nr:uncharacterized protein TERG_12501 [Trichophyton rubrum CBS 118892]EZF98790.1 hypothetical protein H113_01357 [Trichophyton rubrum MR1459]EZG09849.1 hypothetical protein H106_01120 [Trichophyton rubrum CBS 735.88]KFL62548.1 hypothetical protein TERG_12501 [Trichophyton rubrum CBS 118892]